MGSIAEHLAEQAFGSFGVTERLRQEIDGGTRELPAYRRQISIYASAVGKAKNTHTSAFLLRV